MFFNTPGYAEVLVSLGKTEHKMGLLADSLESLGEAEIIREMWNI